MWDAFTLEERPKLLTAGPIDFGSFRGPAYLLVVMRDGGDLDRESIRSMKGIILAGGSGSRLHPATLGVSKQMLPIYDKPMIYYPLGVLMLAGIREVLIISTPVDLPRFRDLLGQGERFGIKLSYALQEYPRGLADAFIVGRDFVGEDPVALILGDNIFYGAGLGDLVRGAASRRKGATIFAYGVDDPERYGVISFDAVSGEPNEIVEKPDQPLSRWAVTGLYFYDNRVLDIAASLSPSARGEIEITDVNRRYLELGDLNVQKLGRGFAWLDTGTHESLFDASSFIRAVERRQGIKVMCLEEIALELGYLSPNQLTQAAEKMGDTDYARYLRRRANEATGA